MALAFHEAHVPIGPPMVGWGGFGGTGHSFFSFIATEQI